MKVLAGLAITVACLFASAAEMPHSIEYRILSDKLYIVASDLNGEMVGISDEAIEDWPVGVGVPDGSHELHIGSAGDGTNQSTAEVAFDAVDCGEVRVVTESDSYETETHIIVITTVKVYCDDELLDVFTHRIKVPKPESEEAPDEK